MRTVHVDLGERGYNIRIGRDLPVGTSLKEKKEGVRALIVSDSNVAPLHGDRCEEALHTQGFETIRTVVPAGEASKGLESLRKLYDKGVESGLDRASVIVALGGGMIGDLAGFMAATFLRGIRLIQVPTSLLAMVDSSVGGKTGINLPEGKNLVGAFYQPVEVVADLSTLKTLPEREYISGLAEVVKYGVIWDTDLFAQLEENSQKVLDRKFDVLEGVIARCCEIKAEVVALDERESGVRAILNFGHTLGHALEKVIGYGRWLHGEAVAVGMVYAAQVSTEQKGFPAEDYKRLTDLLRRFGLPVGFADLAAKFSWGELRQAIAVDKKARGEVVHFVLAERLGSVTFGCEVPEEVLKKMFQVSIAGG